MAPAGYGSSVEGIHAVAAAAAAGRVTRLWVERGRAGRDEVSAIVEMLPRDRVSIVDDIRDKAETTAPQGWWRSAVRSRRRISPPCGIAPTP